MKEGIVVKIPVPTVKQRFSHQNNSFKPSPVFEIVKDKSNNMNKNNRQKRTGPTRPQQRGRSNIIEGVYNNVHFMHSIASQIGNVVQVQTKSGSIFEGIFFTVSPQFDIVLQIVHRLEATANLSKSLSSSPLSSTSTGTPSNNSSSSSSGISSGNSTISSLEDQSISSDSIYDVLIFKANDVVYIKAKDADLDYATKDTFQTDTAISKCNGGRYEEKELEPWQFDGDNSSVNGDVDISLELDNNANGWDVNDMFTFNETRYGVQSTFDQSLTGYTIQIQKKDTQDFKDAEEQAEKIAQEIESQPAYKERTDLEDGDENEEAKFAAVERPQSSSPDEHKVGKYVAPCRRKHNTQAGKLIRPAQIQMNSNNSSNNSDIQQQSSNKYSSLVSHSLPPSQQKSSPSATGQQPPLMHRIHQPQIQQVTLSHKMNGEDQLGNEMKHNHHRRHRSDIDGDRDRDRDRGDMISRDRENRDPRDRDSRDPRDRDGRDNRDLRDKGTGPMPQRGMRHYQSTVNQQIQQSGNANAFSEGVNNNNNGNNQMMVTSPMNQMPQSHQGPPQLRMFHNASSINQDNSPHVIVPAHLVMHQQQIGPPPQPQRPRIRDEQIAEFRKFKQNFNLATSKNSREPQQQVPIEMRSTMDESGSKLSYQSQIKPHVNQAKQYSNQSNEVGSNASSITASNVDTEKRQISTMQQQQMKPSTATTNSNQNVNPMPEGKVESYVSVVQQTQNQQLTQQLQKGSGSSQAINSVLSQHHQSPSPAEPQQMVNKERDNERSNPSTSEQQQEYQTVPNQTPQQHVVNMNSASGTGNSPPTLSASQTSNNTASEPSSTEKAANAPKKFVLNPAAKPFTPRIPVTPNSSRPHTPQTPGTQLTPTLNSNGSSGSFTPQTSQIHGVAPPGPIPPQQPTPQPSAIPGQHVPQPQVMMTYFMPPQQSYPGAPHTQAARFRKGQIPQMQVATAASAVTGAPLHVATPMAMPQFISPYSQAHPTQPYQPYQQVRMYHEAPQPQQIQYITSTTPSTTPSPGQPQAHQQQYHQGPQPVSTAQYAQTAPQQVQMIPLFNAPPVVATPYMQPPNSGPFLVMQQHPPQ